MQDMNSPKYHQTSIRKSSKKNHNNTNNLMKKSKLTISEMAKINGISRQTLIYYDKHGIFQPDYVNEKGYRLYSIQSIPYLREICFLKSIGIPLEDINKHIYKRNPDNVFEFLSHHRQRLEDQIKELHKKKERITNRLSVYEKALKYKNIVNKPTIQYFPERKVCFYPWEEINMNRTVLHLTLMKVWRQLEKYGFCVENGWGAMLPVQNLLNGKILEGAGAYANLPANAEIPGHMENIITIPEGDYACMCKYGMPYEVKYVYQLVEWIERNNYQIAGDIFDECFLDTTFYEQHNEVDFCQIQILVKKKERT